MEAWCVSFSDQRREALQESGKYDERNLFIHFKSLKKVEDHDKFNPCELVEYERNKKPVWWKVVAKPGQSYLLIIRSEFLKFDTSDLFGTIEMEAFFDTDEEDVRKVCRLFVCEKGMEKVVSALWCI